MSLYERTLREECGYKGAMPCVFLFRGVVRSVDVICTRYWDWTQDVAGNKSHVYRLLFCTLITYIPVARIRLSPLLSPVTGFGGDGVNGTYTLPSHLPESSEINSSSFLGCVMDGPFAFNATNSIGEREGFMVHLGPGKMVTTHCLVRGIDERYTRYLSEEVVKHALVQPTYESFRTALEGVLEDEEDEDSQTQTGENRVARKGVDDVQDDFEPSEHDSGHLAIGGDLGNLYSSPGGAFIAEFRFGEVSDILRTDPLFFLHHANIDRIWWVWQTMDLERRLLDMSGSVRPLDMEDSKDDSSLNEPEIDEEEYDGIEVPNHALNHVGLGFGMKYGPLGRTVSVRELMDVTQFPLCYRYL